MMGMTNDEFQMTKKIQMTNDEMKLLSFRAKSRNPVTKSQRPFHGILRLPRRLPDPLRMTLGRSFMFRHSFDIRHSTFVIFTRLVLILAVAVAVSCSGKRITKANADEVREGMTKKQVESILGSPSSRSTDTYVYRQGKESVTIIFKDDKVAEKESTLTR